MRYRGLEYDACPPSLEIVEGDVVGRYRGQPIRQKYVKHLPEANLEFRLRYRGVAYGAEAVSQIQGNTNPLDILGTPGPTPLPITSQIVSLQRRTDAKLSETHHFNLIRNLEHRLQVARRQGNGLLVQALEAERELI